MQDQARAAGWATSHVECRADGVQIDRFETLYPKIVEKLLAEDMPSEQPSDGAPLDPVRFVLDKWTRGTLDRAGIKDGALRRPFDADNRLYGEFQRTILRSSLSPDFSKALTTYARASLVSDDDTTNRVCGWLRGTGDRVALPSHYLEKPVASAGLPKAG